MFKIILNKTKMYLTNAKCWTKQGKVHDTFDGLVVGGGRKIISALGANAKFTTTPGGVKRTSALKLSAKSCVNDH